MDDRWEFWIDVGGTFTDCLARDPQGVVRTYKLLSSGVVKGVCGADSTTTQLRVDDRGSDPAGFFEGYRLHLAAAPPTANAPQTPIERTIVGFDRDAGTIALDEPLAAAPAKGTRYEIVADEEAPVVGIRWLLGRRRSEPIGDVSVRLGTTRGTNALLERQGAPTALVTTRGFADVLRIGYQHRPKIFDLHIRRSDDLFREAVEIDERLDSQGRVLRPLDLAGARDALARLHDRGITSLAICLLHAYRNPDHEERLAAIAEELGFEQISVSSRLSPLQRIVDRGDTTVVDAYLTPIIREYIASIRASLPDARLKLMTSAGSLTGAEKFVGKDSILSGPAGGVVGAAHVGQTAGFPNVIAFDMGGTSTDVSRFDGNFERRYTMEVNDPESGSGVRVVAPMLSIETVAAGGGSICWFDGQKVCVGPRSAGSNPGPACYGRGGPLTVTDVNLFLGRIPSDRFAFPLDRDAVERRLSELIDEVWESSGQRYTPEKLAEGFIQIANANMASAIKKVSIARGYDVRDDALVSFGGAGGQHACAIARELGIGTILQHPHAGVLSAFGIGMADVTKFAERDVGKIYNPETLAELDTLFETLETSLREKVLAEGIAPERVTPGRRLLDLRYDGQNATITIARPKDGDYSRAFERKHHKLYGFTFPGRTIEIHAARMEITGTTDRPAPTCEETTDRRPAPTSSGRAYFDGAWGETAHFDRTQLRPGDRIFGPAIIAEPISTIVVEPGWEASVTGRGEVLLEDRFGSSRRSNVGTEVDVVTLELFNNQFASIAEQMGATLQKTALSTNVKERLDFSCALFTAEGDLVANAPHIPVHLGAMRDTIKAILAEVPEMRPGEAYITNDPYRGGSHLPDVTVISPVFDETKERILFFTGSRAHHAEIGGIVPGSMPAFSTSLAEEGVLIPIFRLVAEDQSSESALRDLLEYAPYPTRSIEENIADINAQLAANQTGVRLLRQLVGRYGLETVKAYMRHIRAAAEAKMRTALLKIPAGEHHFKDQLDDGTQIAVTIDVRHTDHGGEALVSFEGTGPVHAGNLNANPAIVRSALLYCLRCLIDEEIPLNDGVMAPATLWIPRDTILFPQANSDPTLCPAVGGGNVETSQRVVDVILGALGVVAASQGTMNNLLFGRSPTTDVKGFGYYETIGGGSGAGPGFHGASAVHSHMTNTRLTDPEVFEDRYPVRLREFAIRRGSGGEGRYRGGDGIRRVIEFLDSLDVSVVSNRRRSVPYGQRGGGPGKPGRNLLLRSGQNEPEDLGPAAQLEVGPGDVLTIETPGGGSWGRVATSER
ncbi:Acetophenone carboxylase gamma subunit [Planctomycetes bacterium Pan216]|uniref:Acetophenone carboxylase gamma subunit n=1 Tax=Kolteria novifilia TaxID=2527975 RepID=A0A518BBV2_9BACT|nr:Acetophenone carboxylase gamma subunit [Planctomycetes bacterium Pan216]